MEKFNNTTIFTGYLKQLLANFNLPKYRIYTRKHKQYFEKNKKESPEIIETVTREYGQSQYENGIEKIKYPNTLHYVSYIKNDTIQQFVNGKWVEIGAKENSAIPHVNYYDYGMNKLNFTKNLQIKNNSYDSYTHEYLGDYLRFKRDYSNINLMPLYNCFSNRRCDSLKTEITRSFKANYLAPVESTKLKDFISTSRYIGYYIFKDDEYILVTTENKDTLDIIIYNEGAADQTIPYEYPTITLTSHFDTADTAYKIYMVPVKLFQKYTIALDCATDVELYCGLYGAYQDKREKFNEIIGLTYERINGSNFSQPFLYTKLFDFIDYSTDTVKIDKTLLADIAQNECDLKLFIKVPSTNTSTIVVLEGDYLNWNDSITTWKSSPENKPELDTGLKTITNRSVVNIAEIPSNELIELKTPLQLLRFNTSEQHPFADRLIEYLIGNVITSDEEIANNVKRVQKVVKLRTLENNGYQYKPKANGAWDTELNYNIYTYINLNNNTYDINHDVLGFVDKDAEKYYYYKDEDGNKISISNIELNEEGK